VSTPFSQFHLTFTIENKKLEQFVLKNIDKLKAGERDLYL